MAKIRPGSIVGNIRGSIGATTYSQNRYGMYCRNRAIPTKVRNGYTERIRDAFSAVSQSYQLLPYEVKEQWRTWAQSNPVRDKFGEVQVLSPSAAFIKLNTRLVFLGQDINPYPPGKGAPPALAGIGIDTVDEENIKINTTPDTLETGQVLAIYGYVTDSAGQAYIENRLRFLTSVSKLTSAPINVKPFIEAKYGTLQKDWYVWIRCYVVDIENGQRSGPASIAIKYTWTTP
jgi:hypothetical protein